MAGQVVKQDLERKRRGLWTLEAVELLFRPSGCRNCAEYTNIRGGAEFPRLGPGSVDCTIVTYDELPEPPDVDRAVANSGFAIWPSFAQARAHSLGNCS